MQTSTFTIHDAANEILEAWARGSEEARRALGNAETICRAPAPMERRERELKEVLDSTVSSLRQFTVGLDAKPELLSACLRLLTHLRDQGGTSLAA